MTLGQAKFVISLLREQGLEFDKGLSYEEIMEVERVFRLKIPPDLSNLLQCALPTSNGFPHWRHGLNSDRGMRQVLQSMSRPIDGILRSVRYENFWHELWGAQPDSIEKQLSIATEALMTYPKLLPLFFHQFLPEGNLAGNPVFSIYGVDCIVYNVDIMSYLVSSFRIELPNFFGKQAEHPAYVTFWSDLGRL